MDNNTCAQGYLISNHQGGIERGRSYLKGLMGKLINSEKGFRTEEESRQKFVPATAEREARALTRIGRDLQIATGDEMNALVNNALTASLKFSEATIPEYANRKTRLPLIGEKDKQWRREGDCPLREIAQLESKIEVYIGRLAAPATM